MKKPAACRKRPARAVQKKPSKSRRTDWNWAGVVMGPCETYVNKGSVAICLKAPLMLYASDDEADLSKNCNVGGGVSGATSLVKASKSTSVEDLVQRICRCGRKVCFQQFSGQTKAITAKRAELESLDPQDRVS